MELAVTLLIFITILAISLPCFGILILVIEWVTRYILTTVLSWSTLDLISMPDFDFESYDDCNSIYESSYIYSWLSSTGSDNTALRRVNTVENCVFCLCHVRVDDEIRELRCGHVFHRTCLDKWVDHGHLTCPLCRKSLLVRVTKIIQSRRGGRAGEVKYRVYR